MNSVVGSFIKPIFIHKMDQRVEGDSLPFYVAFFSFLELLVQARLPYESVVSLCGKKNRGLECRIQADCSKYHVPKRFFANWSYYISNNIPQNFACAVECSVKDSMKDFSSSIATSNGVLVRLRCMEKGGKFDWDTVLNDLNRILEDCETHENAIIWLTVDTHMGNPVITFGCSDQSENGPNYTTTHNYSW